MKSIDIKSLIIGALLTSTIFLGVAATSKDDAGKWDNKQDWSTEENSFSPGPGWEPIGTSGVKRLTINDPETGKRLVYKPIVLWRKRTK